MRGKGDFWFCELGQNGVAHAAGLLRSLQQDFLPALGTLPCSREQGLLTARGRQWNDGGHAEFRGLFDGPFEHVELYNGKQKRYVQARMIGRQFLEERKLNTIAA